MATRTQAVNPPPPQPLRLIKTKHISLIHQFKLQEVVIAPIIKVKQQAVAVKMNVFLLFFSGIQCNSVGKGKSYVYPPLFGPELHL